MAALAKKDYRYAIETNKGPAKGRRGAAKGRRGAAEISLKAEIYRFDFFFALFYILLFSVHSIHFLV